MSLCGQSPLYVPTTINAQIKNIDAVDVAATNISCTNLTVNGEPISTAVQNLAGSTPGTTVFSDNALLYGDMTINGKLNVNKTGGTIKASTLLCDNATLNTSLSSGLIWAENGITSENYVNAETILVSQGITASSGEFGTIGVSTQATIADLQTPSITADNVGVQDLVFKNSTQLVSGISTFQTVNANSMEVGSDLYMADGTAVLHDTSVNTLTVNSNMNQVTGTTSLKNTTINGNLTVTGLYSGILTSVYSYYLATGNAANNATTTVVFDTLKINIGDSGLTYATGLFKNASTTTRTYLIVFNVSFGLNTTGQRQVLIQKSATALPTNVSYSNSANAAAAGATMPMNVTGIVMLAANETFNCAVYQNSGASLAISTAGVTILAL